MGIFVGNRRSSAAVGLVEGIDAITYILTLILIIIGLVVFETINSVDNAIVNAHILRTMSVRARRWFLLWGSTDGFKNGTMTSIGLLGLFMIFKSFGAHIPEWLPTLTTVSIVGVAFWSSHRNLQREEAAV